MSFKSTKKYPNIMIYNKIYNKNAKYFTCLLGFIIYRF